MNKQGWTRAAAFLLALFLLFSFAVVQAEQSSPEVKTVRVGYVNYVGYEEGGESGHKTGYGYEYLQRIAYHAGWEYEYVYGSFSDLFDMLQHGEIDLMGDISYTEERAEKINYSAYPMSKEYYYLVCAQEDQRFPVGDPFSVQGMRLGVTKDSFQALLLDDWLSSNHISAQVLTYNGSKAVGESLIGGETDAIVITKTYNATEYRSIANIGYSEVYFGLAKGRADLLQDINRALYSIQSMDPMYNDKVTHKYASYQNTDMTLSEEELRWLDGHGELHIGYLDDYLPLSTIGENGQPEGLLPVLVNQLLGNLTLENRLSVSYTPFTTITDITEALRRGEIDAGFPFLSDYWYTELRGLSETSEVASSTVSLVCKGQYTPETIHSLAVTDSGALQMAYASVWFPDCEIVPCSSQEECLQEVMNGHADGCLLLSSRAQFYLDFVRYQGLHSVQCPQDAYFCFELTRNNLGLLMLLNRSISVLDMTETLDRMNTFLPNRTGYSFMDFVQDHSTQVFLISAGLLLLIGSLFLLYIFTSRRSRRQLAAMKDEALRASEAKSTFLFNMSHDIRTPMNAIIGFNREASRHTDDPAALQDCLDKVHSSSTYLLGIINDVLDMSQIDNGNVTLKEDVTDLNQVSSDLMVLLESCAVAKQQTLSRDLQITHPFVMTDGLRLRQILMNIIDNAIKYTPEGGTIRFSMIETPCEEPGYASYTFVTEDNGIGMSEEFQKHAFEPFTREKNTTASGVPGTGLGLSIVSGYTALMGGEIIMDSTQGVGTRMEIRFRFPTAEGLSVEETKAELPLEERTKPLRGKRILVVEDNEINCELALNVLEFFGMVTDSAENGRVAVDKLRTARPGEYDFVLMDIQMPVMDGYEAAREIRQMDSAYGQIPIIGLSANAFDSDRANSREAGMNAHLAKPLDVDLLADTLVQYCARK